MAADFPRTLRSMEASRPVWRGWAQAAVVAGLAGVEGFPLFTQLHSDDFARLEQLRAQLLPGPVPESVLAQEKWNARLEGMSEDERRVAFAQMMLEGTRRTDELLAARHGDLAPPPAELAGLIQGVEARKAQMLADLQQRAGDRLDPDMLRMLEATMERAERALQQQAEETQSSQ
jgi:hypothetical protein